MNEKTCKDCLHFDACSKWTDFPKQCGVPVCARFEEKNEGKWKAGKQNGQYAWYCTKCEAGFTGENAEWIAKSHDYCPKCGAKMIGGE